MDLGECKLCGIPVNDRDLTPRQVEMYEMTGMCPDCFRKTNKAMKENPVTQRGE